jgi:Na+/proline symporter
VFLLAGNLVGTGRVIAFLFGMEPIPGIWICCLAVWLYTIAGGECL